MPTTDDEIRLTCMAVMTLSSEQLQRTSCKRVDGDGLQHGMPSLRSTGRTLAKRLQGLGERVPSIISQAPAVTRLSTSHKGAVDFRILGSLAVPKAGATISLDLYNAAKDVAHQVFVAQLRTQADS